PAFPVGLPLAARIHQAVSTRRLSGLTGSTPLANSLPHYATLRMRRAPHLAVSTRYGRNRNRDTGDEIVVGARVNHETSGLRINLIEILTPIPFRCATCAGEAKRNCRRSIPGGGLSSEKPLSFRHCAMAS